MLLAFAVRFVCLVEASSLPLFLVTVSDAQAYWDGSNRIAAGDRLGDTVFYQAPLYPYFLALAKLAAAQAANGRFDAALATIERARAVAEQRGDTTLMQTLREREARYAQRRPWRPAL